MADLFPFTVFGQSSMGLSSSESASDDLDVQRAMNGQGRARVFFTQPKREWVVVHPCLSEVQVQQLDAFYETHRGVVIELPVDTIGNTVGVVMLAPPARRMLGGGLYEAQTRMAEFP